MPEKQNHHSDRRTRHCPHPGGPFRNTRAVERPGQHHKSPLSGEHRTLVEDVSQPRTDRLRMVIQRDHVISIRGNIMGCGTECGQQEAGDQPSVRPARAEHECDGGKTQSDRHLGGEHPSPLGSVRVHQGSPEELQAPRQSDHSGPERHCAVGHSETGEHHHGNAGCDSERQTFREIDAGNPSPAAVPQSFPELHHVRIRDSDFPEPLRYCRAGRAVRAFSDPPARARPAERRTAVRVRAERCPASC